MLEHRCRPWNHLLASCLIGAACLGSARASLTTIAYDGFSYPASTLLEGKNGGTGWDSAWRFDYTYGENFQTTATGLTYPGLDTTGGAITWFPGEGNGISANDRGVPLQDHGVVYVQFLSIFGPDSVLGTPNVRLMYQGDYVAGFGGAGGDFENVMSILNADLNPLPSGASSTSAPLDQLNLVIVRVDYDTQATSMWVNPVLATFDYDLPPVPDAVYLGLAPAFDAIGIFTRDPGTVDEVKVMDVIPEPATWSLLTAAGAGLLALRRRLS